MKSEVNRINQMECDMTEVKTDIKYIKNNIEEIKDFIKTADHRYASKTTQKIVYGMVGLIVTAVLYALLYLVIIK